MTMGRSSNRVATMSRNCVSGLPLGFQYIYTSLACRLFAEAMIGHPCAAGGRVVGIWTSDPKRTDGAPEDCVHTAILLPGGELLDAEGRRSFGDLCRDFGMLPDLCSIRNDDAAQPSDSGHARLVRHLANLCGWSGGAPPASETATASADWVAARSDFEARGGMCGAPEDMLSAAITEIGPRTGRPRPRR